MGGDGSNIKILNTKTNEIKEQMIEGEIKDSYYDETTNRIYYYIDKYNFKDGIDELSETKVYSIDPDTLKSEFLYFVPVSDKPSADVNTRTIIPSEDSYVCIDCSNNEKIETYKVDEKGKSKLVSTADIQGAEDYDSNDGVQDGPNIVHKRGEYTYNYNMESKELSTFDLELTEFLQPVKFKDGKVYYFKKGQLESIDEEGNIKQESCVELKGGQIKAFLLP